MTLFDETNTIPTRRLIRVQFSIDKRRHTTEKHRGTAAPSTFYLNELAPKDANGIAARQFGVGRSL